MKKTPKGHRNFHSGRNFFPIGQTTFEVNCRRVVQKKRSTVATYINKIKLLLTIETNALPQRKRKKYCLSPTKHETPMTPHLPHPHISILASHATHAQCQRNFSAKVTERVPIVHGRRSKRLYRWPTIKWPAVICSCQNK